MLHLSVSRKWLELGLELQKLDSESAVSDSGQVADTAVLQANQIREFRRFFFLFASERSQCSPVCSAHLFTFESEF